MKRSLADWLSWQEQLHLSEIDLGLERIGKVAKNLGILAPPFPIITVAGTNGKGSCIAMLESILRAQGYQTGAYTSPHLIRYNERIAINNQAASDAQICAAFETIDKARQNTPDENGKPISLTYFEFGTLAAILCFIEQNVDIALLEVGLGGRLDAANLWDASIAIITGIAIDHENWLGNDRETIGREKAGIMRHQRPVVCGDPEPPKSIQTEASRMGARLYQLKQDFDYHKQNNGWTWQGWDKQQFSLPLPALKGEFQLNNAATVVAALNLLGKQLPLSKAAFEQGLKRARLAGRMQIIQKTPEWLLDVAHNPQSAEQLASYLKHNPLQGKTHAIFSMLADKDIHQVISLMQPFIDHWHIFGLPGNRAQTLETLEHQLQRQLQGTGNTSGISAYKDFTEVFHHLKKSVKSEDRVVAFGSFLVVSAVLETCQAD
jgi:dihydrofolate synthase/folylpolyglutamate synthase